MYKETISNKQAIAIMVLFLSGSTSVFVTGLDAKKDVWLAIITAIFMVTPMLIVFARLHHIFPDKDLFDIIKECFGSLLGKGIIIVFTWYSFFWGADVLNNYGRFIRVVSLNETPKTVTIMLLATLSVLCIKQGIEVLGRCSSSLVIIMVISIIIMVSLLSSQVNINNFLPVLQHGVRPIIEGANSVFTQPFVQTVSFTMAFSSFTKKKSSYKVYFIGLLLGAAITLIIAVTNILVIGVNGATNAFYPSYVTASRMDIGDLIQRLEVIIAIIFVLGGFVKISILLLCTCKGVTKLFGLKDYRFIIWPITLSMLNLTFIQYESVMHHFNFNTYIWPYYFFPFQVVLPIIIWIVSEIRKKQFNSI